MERRFAAILAADAVGYSKMMGADEEAAFAALGERRDVIDTLIESHGGRIFGSAGDSVIAEHNSSVEAVRAALEIQERLGELNRDAPEADRMEFRIGVNFGDVMVEEGNLLGDGVNVAARLESLAPAGGVCISGQVAEQISGKIDTEFAHAGRHRLKNIRTPVPVLCWPPEQARRLRPRATGARLAAGFAAVGVVAAMFTGYVLLHDTDTATTGPRIAVIPFANLGGDGKDAFFSAGLTDDINAYLSKFSNLFVIARSSVRTYSGIEDCKEIRDELNADFILAGAVRRSSDRIRVTTTFADARSCRQLKSPGPFDADLSVSDILDIQLEIARKVVAQVGSADAPLFNTQLQNELRRKGPENLKAYECVLLSYWFYETFEPDRHRRARSCLANAVVTDPDYSLGWSRLAFSYIETRKYSIDTPDDWAALSRQAADRAIEIDPDNPDAYYALAILNQMTGGEATVFQKLAERAIELNPNDAFVLADLGTWMGYTGSWELGKDWVTRSKQLNPKHQSWLDYIWHLEHYLNGEYREARDVALAVNLPNNYMVQASLAATYAMNGEQEKAEQTLTHVLELRPDYSKDPRAPFRVRRMLPKLIEGLMDGLRKAGLDVPADKN